MTRSEPTLLLLKVYLLVLLLLLLLLEMQLSAQVPFAMAAEMTLKPAYPLTTPVMASVMMMRAGSMMAARWAAMATWPDH